MSSYKPITPTYTATLNAAIIDVVRALNRGDYPTACKSVLTLVDISPPKIQKECWIEINRIAKQVGLASGNDLYQTRVAKKRVLKPYIRPLLRKVMAQLHKEGYLEKPGVKPRFSGDGVKWKD